MSGEGAPGAGGGEAGDLFLVVEVLPDPRFERNEDDLLVQAEVPLLTAVLGGEVMVPTMEGTVTLTVPPETQNGRRFRLRGKGMPRLRQPAEHGDLFATLSVVLPTHVQTSGMPPAWDEGDARPWPTQQELREQRSGRGPSGTVAARRARRGACRRGHGRAAGRQRRIPATSARKKRKRRG